MYKSILVLAALVTPVFFTISVQNGTSIPVALIGSLIMAIPAGWALGLVLVLTIESLKLLKPFLNNFKNWMYK